MWFTLLCVFAVGAIIGSFLNVVIYRLPRGESLISPGSRCPLCGHSLAWYDNIPIISYLILRGRCRYCGKKISPRYLLVEITVATSFLTNYILWGLSWEFFSFELFFLILVTATLIDLDYKRIPDVLTFGGLFVGLLLSGLTGFIPLKLSVLGAILGGLTLLILRFLGGAIFKKEALGIGDVKFLSSIGAFLGPVGAISTLFLGSIWGTAMIPIFLKEQKTDGRIPFGPFLTLGALSFLYYGQLLVRVIRS